MGHRCERSTRDQSGTGRSPSGTDGAAGNNSNSRSSSDRAPGSGQVRPAVRARPRYAPTVPFPRPSEAAIALSLIPCAYFNRSTSCIRRIDSRPVGISAPSLKTRLTVASDCRPIRPRSRGTAAHHRVESLPMISWNGRPSSRGTRTQRLKSRLALPFRPTKRRRRTG